VKGIVICSGGMDSVTLAYSLQDKIDAMTILSFNYGQRHSKELRFAEDAARDLKVPWHLAHLDVNQFLEGSALTDARVAVPEGHYEEESMKATVVPNRNMMMLSVATALAVSSKSDAVYIGVHAGDHAIYPDCRPEFVTMMSKTAKIATQGFSVPDFEIVAPFVNMSKADIVDLGEDYNVPWARTWSCYKGDMWHCGKCGTCVERKEAFALAGVDDPTIYSV